MLENLNKKQKIIFISILIFMIIIIIYNLYSTLNKDNSESFSDSLDSDLIIESESENKNIDENKIEEDSEILVHVSGCVKNNTVVSLKPNSRIKDAIDAAGGLTNDADLNNINLAYILEDGEKIYIPKKGEEITNYEASHIENNNKDNNSNLSSSLKTQKININKATQAELEIIPGVGPSTALKILEYRKENGKFNSIEDIKNISGIGTAKYEKMKEYITTK